jgi:hypothetical protein
MRPEVESFMEDLKSTYASGDSDREKLYGRGKDFFPLSKDEEDAMVKLAPDFIVRVICDVLRGIPEAERLRKRPADSKTARQLLNVLRAQLQ